MSKKICFKSIVEWVHREHCCDKTDFFIRDIENSDEKHIQLIRYNNCIAVLDGNTRNCLGNIYLNSEYTNKKVSNLIHNVFSLKDSKYHITVTYKDLARDLDCFEFTTGGNDD